MQSNNFTQISITKEYASSIKNIYITSFKIVNIDLNFTKFEFPFENLVTLACYNFKLKHFSNINNNVTYLLFSNVSWTSIKSYYFTDLIKLKKLFIVHNNIRIIQNYTFKGLISLFYLELNNNNITCIEADAFYGLVNLLYLELNYNSLVELCMDTFNIYNKIVIFKHIDIQNNRLNIIKSGLFFSNYIHKLNLSNNIINSIEINAFDIKLKILNSDINVGQLSTIAENMFDNLQKLKTDTVLNNTIMCNCQKFNWTFNNAILKLMNISKHYYIVCNKLENVVMTCTNTKGKYIYIYIYIYTYLYIYLVYIFSIYT